MKKVTIKADVILTITDAETDKETQELILLAEQRLNEVGLVRAPISQQKVGIRVHFLAASE